MRFTRGCKVEVFSVREVSTGSWRPAEILSGDGRNYTVVYDKFADKAVIGWVSKEVARPCPPLGVSLWVSGDIVEVFDDFSWKLGTVVKGLGQKQVLVELHGWLVNIKVSLDEIRVRHSWQDGKWIVLGKPMSYRDGKYCEMQLQSWSPYMPTQWEYSAGASRKYKHVEKDGQSYRSMINPSGEHAYTMPSRCYMNGKKRGQSSLVIRFPLLQKSESSQSVDSLPSVRSDSNDEDSDLCSVGSCSTTDSWSRFIHPGPIDDSNGDLNDAESNCAPSYDNEHYTIESLEKAAAVTIHQLELQGYRSTLRALHAAGPLSWDQQSLISNLRLSLNISNDEHLMELKSLLSS